MDEFYGQGPSTRRDSFFDLLQGLNGEHELSSEVNRYLDSFPTLNSINEAHISISTTTTNNHHTMSRSMTEPLWAAAAGAAGTNEVLPDYFVDSILPVHVSSSTEADNVLLQQKHRSPSPSPSPQVTPLVDCMNAMLVPDAMVGNRKRASPDPGHGSRPPLRSRSMPGPHATAASSSSSSSSSSSRSSEPTFKLDPPEIKVTAELSSWKSSFRTSAEREAVVKRLQLVIQEYINDTGLFAAEIEKAAFDNAEEKDEYDKLLAIQCYKVRKLARGELQAPPSTSYPLDLDRRGSTILPRPSDSNVHDHDLTVHRGGGGATTTIYHPRPSHAFLGDLSAEALLTWEP